MKELTRQKKAAIVVSAVLLCVLVVSLVLFLPKERRSTPWGAPMRVTLSDGRTLSASPSAMVREEEGTFLVCDRALHVIWRVSQTDAVIVAGSVTAADAAGVVAGGYADGDALSARFDTPTDIVRYADGYLISDSANRVIRYFDPVSSTVVTFAGTGAEGKTDGEIDRASFAFPAGMCMDDAGNLYVADTLNHAIRKIDSSGYVSTFLGSAQGFLDGSFDVARLSYPTDVAFLDGEFYIADRANAALRVVRDGELLTALGAGEAAGVSFSPESLTVFGKEVWIVDSVSGALLRFADERATTFLQTQPGSVPCAVLPEEEHVFLACLERETLEVSVR